MPSNIHIFSSHFTVQLLVCKWHALFSTFCFISISLAFVYCLQITWWIKADTIWSPYRERNRGRIGNHRKSGLCPWSHRSLYTWNFNSVSKIQGNRRTDFFIPSNQKKTSILLNLINLFFSVIIISFVIL